MMHDQTISVLNRLLAAECGNLIFRLGECNPFVNWPAADDRAVVAHMLVDSKAHQAELANLILKLKGSPTSASYPTALGGVHYLKLSYLIPQVMAGVRGLIQAYEASSGTGHPEADALISRIVSDHRRHLAELERLHSNLAAAHTPGTGPKPIAGTTPAR
jgi:hypothetical protein